MHIIVSLREGLFAVFVVVSDSPYKSSRERAATRTRLSTPLNSFDCAEKKTRGSACSLKFQELVKEYIKYKNRRVETGTLFLSVHGCVDF